MLPYALAIFTGAFLLFQIQPLVGKYILPWFGGSPGVWTTCMLFFQMLLLGGYAYAHFSTRRLTPRAQAGLHLALLVAAVLLLPITPDVSWKPVAAGDPTWRILALLTVSLGLPYFVLSSTGPLMQEWFSRTHPGVSPYRLYALSNVGSLLALLSYPFYFEPTFSRRTQAELWGWGLLIFVLLCGGCAVSVWRRKSDAAATLSPDAPMEAELTPPTFTQKLLWLLLPACASVLLLATTNKLCQDVAVIPFLWVLPLALYLLTFIIAFDNPRWYARFLFGWLFAGALAWVCVALFQGVQMPIRQQVCAYSAVLFVGCLICHGELFRLKPHPRLLTHYYLMISAGGALGGLLIAVVGPLVLNAYWELQLVLLACPLVLVLILARERTSVTRRDAVISTVTLLGGGFIWFAMPRLMARWQTIALTSVDESPSFNTALVMGWGTLVGLLLLATCIWRTNTVLTLRGRTLRAWPFTALGVVGLAVALAYQVKDARENVVTSSRNFYGVLTLMEYSKENPNGHYFMLQHGKIVHGLQFAETNFATWPTTYYGPKSGVGLALNYFPTNTARRIGLVGLGTGTLTSYGRKGDYLRVYDIDPAVKHLAEMRFSYVSNCAAKVDIILGDARLSMENELRAQTPQQFDVLALDAFSSDAIPVHLLTREAFAIYQRHLKPDGVIAIHISNRYLNLAPVVDGLAREFKFRTATISDNDEENWWIYASTWVLVTRNAELLASEAILQATSAEAEKPVNIPLWTDDYASLFPILQ